MLATITEKSRATGPRRVNLRTDLAAIADLIEICFSPGIDANGRAAIQEMRALSRLGPLLTPMTIQDEMLRGIGQGVVWVEDGRIVGNVTLHEANLPREFGRTTVIANVAVHPDYRRRGIAREMMLAAMDAVRRGGGTAALLQVEGNNEGARALYEKLGFRAERTWHHWRRSPNLPPPPRLADAPPLTYRSSDDRQEEHALASRAYPQEKGGLGWLRRSFGRQLGDFFGGVGVERLILRDVEGKIAGAVWGKTAFATASMRLTLIADPARQDDPSPFLLNAALRHLAGRERPIICEHPADREAATAAFEHCGFSLRRTLVHMRWDV